MDAAFLGEYPGPAAGQRRGRSRWVGGASRFGRWGEQEGPDLLAASEIVLLHDVGEVLVGLDRHERVKVLRRQLAAEADRAPPAHLPHLLLQL